MPGDTVHRVNRHTAPHLNRRIEQETRQRLQQAARNPHIISQRLTELDREWDIERTLEANAASVAGLGLLLGLTKHRLFLLFPAAVSVFLLQHALQGWCPPMAIFRRLGIRTSREIENERHALKAMRGDYRHVEDAPQHVEQIADAAQR